MLEAAKAALKYVSKRHTTKAQRYNLQRIGVGCWGFRFHDNTTRRHGTGPAQVATFFKPAQVALVYYNLLFG